MEPQKELRILYQAFTHEVPEGHQYFTNGKCYIVEMDLPLRGAFVIRDDRGEYRECNWDDCPHLAGGEWERSYQTEIIALWTM